MTQKTSAIRVRTRFESVDDFIVGYSPFFDRRGLFIRTRRTQEVGTRMRFELQLSDGRAVFRGEGIVDEVREPPMSASGMHLRISKLDSQSKSLFERVSNAGVGAPANSADDPHEVPTFDPDAPSAVLGGGRSGVRSASSANPSAARGATAPAAAESGGGGFDADLLEDIADGIEMSLDAVLLDGPVDGPGEAADWGGFFGSPQEKARATGSYEPVISVERAPDALFEPATSIETPRGAPAADLGLGDPNLALASNYPAESAPAAAASPSQLTASGQVEVLGLHRDASDSGISFEAHAPVVPEPVADADIIEEDAIDTDIRVPVQRPQQPSDPDLSLAVLAHGAKTKVDEEADLRHTFTSGEHGPGLGDLLTDLLGDKDSSEVDQRLTAEFAVGDASGSLDEGPDPLDALLAKDEDDGGTEQKKGFFKRLFGKKK